MVSTHRKWLKTRDSLIGVTGRTNNSLVQLNDYIYISVLERKFIGKGLCANLPGPYPLGFPILLEEGEK